MLHQVAAISCDQDSAASQVESDESNNSLASDPIVVSASDIDLEVTSVSVSTFQASTGEEIATIRAVTRFTLSMNQPNNGAAAMLTVFMMMIMMLASIWPFAWWPSMSMSKRWMPCLLFLKKSLSIRKGQPGR